MDFRAHQDRARKNSLIIWLLYFLLLGLSSFLIGATLVVGFSLAELYQPQYNQYGFSDKFIASVEYLFTGGLSNALTFSAVAFTAQGFATMLGFSQKSNGHDVAKAFYGRLITSDSTTNFKEQQALNIVHEQALAASIPTPSFYIVPEEGINAFAAGKTMNEAVVAVTEGALEHFNREELSGVIAHEVGHIVNQDIKLNIQISAFVFGFTALFFLARFMFYSAAYNNRMDARAKIVVIVIAAVVAIIGVLTVWMGRVLQAAMSRQREFLADASAVQFTRYPDGLIKAFEVLKNGGKSTEVKNPNANEYAHAMMFGMKSELFATHPPLEERIKRIQKS